MTHIQDTFINTQASLNQIRHFAFFPLSHWSLLINADTNTGHLNKAFKYLLFPFYALANVISLTLAALVTLALVSVLPFQSLYAYMTDLFTPATEPLAHEYRPVIDQSKPIMNNDSFDFEAPDTISEDSDEAEIPKNWKEILEYGRYAPSPHNMQPWLFKVESPDTVTLYYDPKRLLPGTNPQGSFMQVGFGILNETLSIAAAPLGLKLTHTYHETKLNPEAIGPQRFATLKLSPRLPIEAEPLDRKLIIDRRTSRLPYNGKPINPEVLTELSAIAAEYGHKLEFSSEEKQVKWVIRLNADTMFYDMSIDAARNEVGSWMRFSKQDAIKRADGLAAYAMNTPGFLMWFFVHANWLFRLPGIYSLVRNSYEQGMSGTATVSWISGPFETQNDWDNAGHMMARLWLTMTKHGVYLHPFGSVITNPIAHQKMAEHFKNEDREHDLWMLMRLGYGETPPQAQRMPLAKMMFKGGSMFQPAEENEIGSVDTSILTMATNPTMEQKNIVSHDFTKVC